MICEDTKGAELQKCVKGKCKHCTFNQFMCRGGPKIRGFSVKNVETFADRYLPDGFQFNYNDNLKIWKWKRYEPAVGFIRRKWDQDFLLKEEMSLRECLWTFQGQFARAVEHFYKLRFQESEMKKITRKEDNLLLLHGACVVSDYSSALELREGMDQTMTQTRCPTKASRTISIA